jgi:hypothetical protein
MAFQSGTDTLICQHCGSRHKATWERLPVREEHSLRCLSCRQQLLAGKGVKEYFDLELTAD